MDRLRYSPCQKLAQNKWFQMAPYDKYLSEPLTQRLCVGVNNTRSLLTPRARAHPTT